MQLKLSYALCQSKIEYLNQELKSQSKKDNWLLHKDEKGYKLLCNAKIMTLGTLKEIDNYIEGLYKGYGISNANLLEEIEKQTSSITAYLKFKIWKHCIDMSLAKQMCYYSVQEYECHIHYSKKDNNYYITTKIIGYDTFNEVDKSHIIMLPETKLDVKSLDLYKSVEDKTTCILDFIDIYLSELYLKTKNIEYLKRISNIQRALPFESISKIYQIQGSKINGLYTTYIDLMEVKPSNLFKITYKNK